MYLTPVWHHRPVFPLPGMLKYPAKLQVRSQCCESCQAHSCNSIETIHAIQLLCAAKSNFSRVYQQLSIRSSGEEGRQLLGHWCITTVHGQPVRWLGICAYHLAAPSVLTCFLAKKSRTFRWIIVAPARPAQQSRAWYDCSTVFCTMELLPHCTATIHLSSTDISQ